MPDARPDVLDAVTQQLYRILLGELPIKEIEQWVYDCEALEQHVDAEHYLALISLDYRRANALREVQRIALESVDLSAFETHKLRRVLTDIKDRTENAFTSVQATYDLYSDGYYFLRDLGLPYGLEFSEYTPLLVPEAKDELLSGSYPKIAQEADKVLRWLDSGEIVLTGEKNKGGYMDYVDNRPTEDKEPSTSD